MALKLDPRQPVKKTSEPVSKQLNRWVSENFFISFLRASKTQKLSAETLNFGNGSMFMLHCIIVADWPSQIMKITAMCQVYNRKRKFRRMSWTLADKRSELAEILNRVV